MKHETVGKEPKARLALLHVKVRHSCQNSVLLLTNLRQSRSKAFLTQAHLCGSRNLTVLQIRWQLFWGAFITSTTTVILKMTVTGVSMPWEYPCSQNHSACQHWWLPPPQLTIKKAEKSSALGRKGQHSTLAIQDFPSGPDNATSEIMLLRLGSQKTKSRQDSIGKRASMLVSHLLVLTV